MRFEIVTIFPKIFDSYLKESLVKRAVEKNIVEIKTHDLRNYSTDKHKKVDDKPYGGGPGMVLQVVPIYRAVEELRRQAVHTHRGFGGQVKSKGQKTRIILFSTRGKKLNAKIAKRLATCDRLILICGRYEGVDERVAKYIADEEISIGDYVLNGGEVAAMVLIEAVSRFLPGFLGKRESLEEIKGSYATYTRPAEFTPPASSRKKFFSKSPTRWNVPGSLTSGHHQRIRKHRKLE